ncbi:MAG TPA: hypothetical protein VLC09_17735, partial [Polyangiaceae bacterium]|nr:hypothetical protein [Polyangiaceae bacterium]
MPTTRPPKSSRRPPESELPEELASALAAVRANLGDMDAWDALDDVARDLDRPDEVVALYREALGGKEPIPVRIELGRRGADFCEEWFEEPEPV